MVLRFTVLEDKSVKPEQWNNYQVKVEEFEAFDLPQVVAALANVFARMLLMVDDINQRVEEFHRRGLRATFSESSDAQALPNAPHGLEDDGEPIAAKSVSVAQSSKQNPKRDLKIPESRPWHEWGLSAETVVLDKCKRCGESVCDYVRHCFDFATNFTSDPAVAGGPGAEAESP